MENIYRDHVVKYINILAQDIEPVKAIDILKSNRVLSADEEKQLMMEKNNKVLQNKLLIKNLQNMHPRKKPFANFCQALEKAGQEHIANLIKTGIEPRWIQVDGRGSNELEQQVHQLSFNPPLPEALHPDFVSSTAENRIIDTGSSDEDEWMQADDHGIQEIEEMLRQLDLHTLDSELPFVASPAEFGIRYRRVSGASVNEVISVIDVDSDDQNTERLRIERRTIYTNVKIFCRNELLRLCTVVKRCSSKITIRDGLRNFLCDVNNFLVRVGCCDVENDVNHTLSADAILFHTKTYSRKEILQNFDRELLLLYRKLGLLDYGNMVNVKSDIRQQLNTFRYKVVCLLVFLGYGPIQQACDAPRNAMEEVCGAIQIVHCI